MRISLDSNWQCVYADGSSEVLVPSLSGWSHASQEVELKRKFRLDITDSCVNYVLYLNSAPLGTEVSVNGQDITRISVLPFILDVTMFVMLEDNEMVFRVPAASEGRFAAVSLRAVPCE